MISLWDINKISLFDRSVAGPKVPSFLNLETLFLRRSSMDEIPSGFLEKMPLVRVLNLSYNYHLGMCWQVHQLVNLEYLNMSFTSIKAWSIGGLKKLRCLILNFTHLKEIDQTLISSLSSLQLLSMHGSSHHQCEFRLFDHILEDNILYGGKKGFIGGVGELGIHK